MDFQPTLERPLLAGLLVDVSGSMASAIENKSGGSLNRLESFQSALGDLAAKAQQLSSSTSGDRLVLFAYGFGFGNLLSRVFGESGPEVRDLLEGARPGSSTVGISELANDWSDFKRHVEGQAFQMFGNTPMLDGIRTVTRRFQEEAHNHNFCGRILFLLSDGEPTDASAEQVIDAASKLTRDGILIVSCFVTNHDITSPRQLYGEAQGAWPVGAKLMYDLASVIPVDSAFYTYLREQSWKLESGARLFTQVNQSQILSEFLQVLVSPLAGNLPAQPASIFISYSHKDAKWLEQLKVVLSPLVRNQKIDVWEDQRIEPGSNWREKIDAALSRASVAILLVSSHFLASRFIQEVELPALLRNAEQRGTRILPIIVAPSLYEESPLASFQAANDPASPLSGMTKAKAEAVIVSLARKLA